MKNIFGAVGTCDYGQEVGAPLIYRTGMDVSPCRYCSEKMLAEQLRSEVLCDPYPICKLFCKSQCL